MYLQRLPNRNDCLYVGDELKEEQKLFSASGEFYAILQWSQFMICRKNGKVIWSKPSTTGVTPGRKLQVRSNCELVIVQDDGLVKWSAGAASKGDVESIFVMKNDGDFVLRTSGNTEVWKAGSSSSVAGSDPVRDRLLVGDRLGPEQNLTSPNKRFRLNVSGSEKRAALYDDTRKGDPIWTTPNLFREVSLRVRDDDNLVLESRDENWQTGTRRRKNGGTTQLILLDEGKLVLRADGPNGPIVWHSAGTKLAPVLDVGVGETCT